MAGKYTAGFFRSFDLVSLRLLLAAVEEGNLARVAAREGVSLSAVSRRITELEARAGVRLLHRHDRGVTPTDIALASLPQLRNIFQRLEEVIETFHAARNGERGIVRVRAHLTAITGALPGMVAAFAAEHRQIDVIVDEATSTEIVHAVQVGDCDMGFISGTVATDGVAVLPWKADELVVVVPPDHPLGSLGSAKFVDVVNYPFIATAPGSALLTLFREQAAAIDRTLDERARVSTFDGLTEMVAAGLGVGILPAAVALRAAEPRGLIVCRLAEPWATRPLMICIRDQAQLSPAARRFLDHLLLAA